MHLFSPLLPFSAHQSTQLFCAQAFPSLKMAASRTDAAYLSSQCCPSPTTPSPALPLFPFSLPFPPFCPSSLCYWLLQPLTTHILEHQRMLVLALGSQGRERVGHSAAGVTVQALYLALSEDTEQCRHLLTGTHTLKWRETTRPLLQQGLHAAILNLWNEKAALSTQLLAAACLARLCAQVCPTPTPFPVPTPLPSMCSSHLS